MRDREQGFDTEVTRRLGDEEGAEAADEVLRGPAKRGWEPGALIGGRYLVTERIGQGGMGVVVAADDLLLRKTVAVKALRPEDGGDWASVERFRREVALAHGITHPNVCRIHDMGEEDGVVYFSMERLAGETLQQRLAREGKLGLAETLRIATRVCDALAVAHDARVVHRDLKPGNIMLVEDEREVVLLDFGISMAIDEPGTRRGAASGPYHATSSGMGTPRYMPPEQWRDEPCTPATDLYALGAIVFQCLTGRTPFEDAGTDAQMQAHLERPAPRLRTLDPSVPSHVEEAVARCLEKAPARRFGDARALAASLSPPARHRAARALLLRVLVTGAVLAALGAGMIAFAERAIIAEMRPAVSRLAELVAARISTADLDAIRGPEDMTGEPFARVLDTLREARAANPDVRFLYVWRRLADADTYEFVVDEEPFDHDDDGDGVISAGEEGVQPGRRYDGGHLPRLAECVRTGYATADDRFAADEFSLALSGYARIGTNDGPGAYVVGVDVDNERMATFRLIVVALCLAAWPLFVALPRWVVFFAARSRANQGALHR